MSSDKPIIDFEGIPWETPVAGLRMKSTERFGLCLRLVEVSSDFKEPDWCLKGHYGYVLEGELEINFNGVQQRVRAGQGIAIPEDGEFRHKAMVIGPSAVLFLVERP